MGTYSENENKPVLVFREINLETDEVLRQKILRIGEDFQVVKHSDSESVEVTLCSDGRARVAVWELVKGNAHFASHLWGLAAVGEEPVWTRNCPLPLGLNYDPNNLAISLQEEKVKKLLIWVSENHS